MDSGYIFVLFKILIMSQRLIFVIKIVLNVFQEMFSSLKIQSANIQFIFTLYLILIVN